MKGSMETNPSESSTVHCKGYALTCEFSTIILPVGSQTQAFFSIIGRSFAKIAVIPIISGFNNSVLIHRGFFPESIDSR